MEGANIWLAHELRAYRETLARALRDLRPNLTVLTLAPSAMDATIRRIKPDLIVCDRATTVVRAQVRLWIELSPPGQSHVTISIDGRQRFVDELSFPDLLALCDEVVPHQYGRATVPGDRR